MCGFKNTKIAESKSVDGADSRSTGAVSERRDLPRPCRHVFGYVVRNM